MKGQQKPPTDGYRRYHWWGLLNDGQLFAVGKTRKEMRELREPDEDGVIRERVVPVLVMVPVTGGRG